MAVLRRILGRIVPRGTRQEIVALRETLADLWRYQRATSAEERWVDECHREDRHEARLTMDYHRIEKSLALPDPRRPFGVSVRDRMVGLLGRRPTSGQVKPYIGYAESALAAQLRWNEGGQIDDAISPPIDDQICPFSVEQASAFFGSRHSVRNFDRDRVPSDDELMQAVELARNTPSVCNRQAFRVHWYRERPQIDAILRIQNGATGFEHVVPAVGVVTARRGMFVGPDERNQRWIDGGLFAMTLVWAFHALGLATCMLNWALPGVSSAKLREIADIPRGEDIVVLIAVGHPSDGARVARSGKRRTDDLAWIHS